MPQAADVEMVSVKVTASDGTKSVSDTFDIRVTEPSRSTSPRSTHCTSNLLELWCATMTVAVSGNNTGFQDTAVEMFGSLSDDDFIVDSATQRIRVLSYNSNTEELLASMTPGFSLETFGKLTLTVGSTNFAYGGFMRTDTQGWSNHGLSWSSGDTVAVKLVRVPNTAPTLGEHDSGPVGSRGDGVSAIQSRRTRSMTRTATI